MGRDRKPSINQDPSRIAFPMPRRASLASSFSLPTLSLPSRSKPTPTLAPLDTSRANGNPLDGESSTSSYITPTVSHPDVSDSGPSTRPVSPLKPPSSPGTAVPLPSIRSLRSRFSFSSHDTPNLPGAVQTPNKRVTSRRFLPFGNSTPSNQPNNTPTIPRKSLGDVFALGRASTSSRFDSTSARSVTPSGRSARSVTSAATMRGPGGWTHTSGGLAPPNSGLSSRPRSDDFSALSADLGYVIAIGTDEETIRRRPDLPPAEPPPLLLDPSQTLDESSQEDITQTTFVDVSAAAALSQRKTTLPMAGAIDIGVSNSNGTNRHATFSDASTSRLRQSPVPPISIPPPPAGIPSERDDVGEKTPDTEVELDADNLDSLPTDFPFTPVDDRSDVTSSTGNTPRSGNRSLRKNSQTLPPPLPSPSPRAAADYLHALPSSSAPLSSLANARKGSYEASASFSSKLSSDPPLDSLPRLRDQTPLSVGQLPGNPGRLQVDTVHGVSGPASGVSSTRLDLDSRSPLSSALGLVETESRPVPPSISKSELPAGSSGRVDSDPRESRRDRLGELLSTLSASMVVNGELSVGTSVQDSDRSATVGIGRKASGQSNGSGEVVFQSGQDRHPSGADPSQNAKYLRALDDDLAKLLSPHRFSPLPSVQTLESGHTQDKSQTAAPTHLPLPSVPLTPQAQSSPLHRPGSRLQQNVSTPSPSGVSFRSNDLLSARVPSGVQRAGSIDRNAVSLNNTPLLSPKKLADQPYQRELATTPNNPSRPLLGRSPSVSAAMTRKRSASFDFSGSTTFAQDLNDPFTAHSNGPKRTDWLGPRTAKAFAAAGLLDKDKERSGLHSNVRSETPVHRGALNAWRTHSERNGPGSVRSHSRLGSEIISPSFRTRSLAGGDSSPSYGRASLDHTAPPSPVSTHRTLVSNATSSSQSQQSALQTLRERHELETEALLLSLAGSKRAERDLRAENEELSAYIVKLERRIAVLEAEKEQQERSKSRAWDRHWNTPSSSDVEILDKRRQDILAGRSSSRGWNTNGAKPALPHNRPTTYGANRPFLLPNETPRSASAASVRRSSEDTQPRSSTPSRYRSSVDIPPVTPLSRARTPPEASAAIMSEPQMQTPETDFEEWNESSFGQALQSSPRADARHRLSSHSAISLLPQMPGSMSMLVHEQPGGESFEEDGVSFGSASPSSLTLVHPRSNTPKPVPANISPITAEFSFNSIPGSPRSLRLRPEEEMHLADLISLQGLEITDVMANLDG